jgi:hypothetical protein
MSRSTSREPDCWPAVLDEVAVQLNELLMLVSCRLDAADPAPNDPLITRAGELDYKRSGWSAGRDGLPPLDVSQSVDNAGYPAGRFVAARRSPSLGVFLASGGVVTPSS